MPTHLYIFVINEQFSSTLTVRLFELQTTLSEYLELMTAHEI